MRMPLSLPTPSPPERHKHQKGCKPKAASHATNVLWVELVSLAQPSPEDPWQQENLHSAAEHPPDYFLPKSNS